MSRRFPFLSAGRRPKPGVAQFGLKAFLTFVGVAALATWYLAGYLPGTLYFDENGLPHGTGTKKYYYPTGALKLEDNYRAGHLTHSRWHRPDGSQFAETTWNSGKCVGYYLRDDGTLRAKHEYVGGRAHGQAVFYDEYGNVERTPTFREGVEIKP